MKSTREPAPAGVLAVPAVVAVLAILVVLRPAAATTVDDLCAPAADPCVVDTAIAVQDMSVLDLGGRDLRIAASGRLEAGSGMMVIVAGAVTVEAGGVIGARGSGSTAGGFIDLRAASLAVAGTIDVAGAPPGQLVASVTGAATLAGLIDAHALARDQSGGVVSLAAGTISLTGTIDARSGTEDSLGGDVELIAANDVSVAGTINVVGPDGGTITIDAGSGPTAGNVILANTSMLLADGAFQGGFGGSIDVTASGDGVTTGAVQASGSMSVNGHSTGIEVGGGSGGCLSINASAGVLLDNAGATLSVTGGGPDGDGGELEIISDQSSVVVLTRLDASTNRNTPEEAGGGGAISIDAAGPILALGQIVAFGGDGGEVAMLSSGAGVTVDAAVTVDVTGAGIGSGGAICLESATRPGGRPAAVVVNGTLNADGGGSAGEGGSVELIGRDSARLAGLASADGGLGGGLGGAVAVTATAGPAFVEGTARARGRGAAGGSITVDGARIEVSGSVDVGGAVAGSGDTDIGLSAAGPVLVSGTLSATSSAGSGGLVEIIAEGDVTLAGTLTADGTAAPGGMISVLGCGVLLCGFNAEGCQGSTGTLRTLGPNGLNRLTARDEAIVFGTMTAAASGRNEVVVRPPTNQNATVLGTTNPTAVVVADAALSRCPLCGNGIVEPPETCDDGNTDDGDGCSSICRREGEIIVGDVNGDTLVNADDLRFLAAEIFDGDGDRVAGSGAPGADVNGDDRITAADFAALVAVLAAP
jgi:cysteine-rich repeat protein